MINKKWAKIYISNGTSIGTVDLLSEKTGLHMIRWVPSLPELKGGGIYQEGLFNEGRQLVQATRSSIVEEITIRIEGSDQDELANTLISFHQLLNQARDYWTSGWNNVSVYLHVRGYQESNDRYAVIHNWSIPTEGRLVFQDPVLWLRQTSTDEFAMFIERGQWQEAPIGEEVAANLYSVINSPWRYPNKYFGTVDDSYNIVPTTEPLFLGNLHTRNVIDQVHWHDAGTPAWSGNLFDTPLPFDLLPATPAVNDALYLGCSDPISPFPNAIFNIGTASADITITWEYWDGAVWSIPSYNTDRTDDFQNTGESGAYWLQENDWTSVDLSSIVTGAPAVTTYWIRARVSAIGGSPSPPAQSIKQLYTASLPYCDLAYTEVDCDVPPLFHEFVENPAFLITAPVSDVLMLGLRSHSRGLDYTPYINLIEDSYNQNNVGILMDPNADMTFITFPPAPTGRCAFVANGTSLPADVITFEISDLAADEYIGKYRVFVRYYQPKTSPLNDPYTGQISYTFLTHTTYLEKVILDFDRWYLDYKIVTADMGVLDLTLERFDSEVIEDIYIKLRLYDDFGTSDPDRDLYIVDIILFPVDEWVGSYGENVPLQSNVAYDIDGCKFPKIGTRAMAIKRVFDLTTIYSPLIKRQIIPPTLQANADQRLFHFSYHAPYPGTGPIPAIYPVQLSYIEIIHRMQMFKVNRFMSLRGTK